MTQMHISEVTKFTPLNPGLAADRVLLIPCTIEPEDPQTIPFMKHRMAVKTLQLPHAIFYHDRALAARLEAQRRGTYPIPPHDFDFTRLAVESDFGNVNNWPILQPLCLQLESMPPESSGYSLFSTNCYFFSRTIFDALEFAYPGRWEKTSHSTAAAPHRRRSTFKPRKGEKLTPMQRTALWLNDTLSNTTEMGELIRATARNMAEGMQNSSDYADIIG